MSEWFIISAVALLMSSCEKEKDLPQPVILGHAGMALSPERAIYPDNSQASIDYALYGLNADGVEVDVQMTKDSVLVLFHDDFIELDNGEIYCVNELDWATIQEDNMNQSHAVIRLTDLEKQMQNSTKFLYLDLKFYNACDKSMVDLETMAARVQKIFEDWNVDQRQRLAVNARNIDLIRLFPANFCLRSFETENIPLAVTYFQSSWIDMICTKAPEITFKDQQTLKETGIPFCLFLIKTRREIEEAALFLPDFVITDNIPATRKYYY